MGRPPPPDPNNPVVTTDDLARLIARGGAGKISDIAAPGSVPLPLTWYPIESAPRDGTVVQLWGRQVDLKRADGEPRWWPHALHGRPMLNIRYRRGDVLRRRPLGWWARDDGVWRPVKPLLWMPAPPVPAISETGGGE